MVAEVVTACTGGAVITGSALHYGASPLAVGLTVAAPQLAQVMHLPAAWLTRTLGARPVAIGFVAASRQALLPLALLPFLGVSPQTKLTILGTVVALAAVLGVIGNNGWTAWMGDLVPQEIRGRYFGRRTAACTLAGSVAALLAGLALDGTPPALKGYGLATVAFVGCLAGAVTTWLMLQQRGGGETRDRFDFAVAIAPLFDQSARRLFVYQLAWNLAVGLAGSFFAMHMLKNLKMGFTLVALHGAALAAARIIACPVWGRAIDRYGSRPVLTACSWGICVLPALYVCTAPDRLWPLACDAILAGVLWSGHSLASFALPLAIAPREQRPFVLAIGSTAGGIAFAVGTVIAGAIADTLPAEITLFGHVFFRLQALFALSAIARVGAATLAPRIVEPGAKPVRALVAALSAVRARA